MQSNNTLPMPDKLRYIISQKAIIRTPDRVFVMKNRFDTYEFPGGTLEYDEDLIAGLKRELQEELGWVPTGDPILMSTYQFDQTLQLQYLLQLEQIPEQEFVLEDGYEGYWLSFDELAEAIPYPGVAERLTTWQPGDLVHID